VKGIIKKVFDMVKPHVDEVKEIIALISFVKITLASFGINIPDEHWFWVDVMVNLVCLICVTWGFLKFNPSDAKLLSKEKVVEGLVRLGQMLFKK